MAKKTKRKVSSVSSHAPAAADVMEMDAVQAQSPVAAAPARSFSRRPASSAPAEFNPDYTYIIKDLKRIATLAGTFFAILIALAFILPLIIK
jgi:hypothetical protein